MLGHALRCTDNDTLLYNFLLSVCNNPIVGLNQFIRPLCLPKAQLDLSVLTIVGKENR